LRQSLRVADHFADLSQRGSRAGDQAVMDLQIMLAHHRQLVLQQQVVVAMDAARQ
jgi:hypothetical protein